MFAVIDKYCSPESFKLSIVCLNALTVVLLLQSYKYINTRRIKVLKLTI